MERPLGMDVSETRRGSPHRLAVWITLVLASAVVVYQGYHLAIALDKDDTNHLETPLALAIARQVEEGPATLYGPFSGRLPLVLVHAPLYYRLAGAGGWLSFALGADAVSASFAWG